MPTASGPVGDMLSHFFKSLKLTITIADKMHSRGFMATFPQLPQQSSFASEERAVRVRSAVNVGTTRTVHRLAFVHPPKTDNTLAKARLA